MSPLLWTVMVDGLKKQSKIRIFKAGVKAVRDTRRCCRARLKISYALRFSSENWNRPKKEIARRSYGIAGQQFILDETKTLMDNNISYKPLAI